ncbi:MAG: Zn-dependent oligopeptidase [Deltaproteobacteria bacterium]|nr:Zn-dependent oligopeptidase [Deltaproteobacteria bacterium]
MKRLSQEYGANVNTDTRTVKLAAAQVADLPKDWRDAHSADAEGNVSVKTDYPDYYPVMEYAADEAARRALWEAQIDRGMPKNVEVLKSILKLRKEAATLLGEPSWAAYAVRDAMAKTPEAVTAFIAEVAEAARPRAERDVARALVAKQKVHPEAKALEVWDRFYYQGVVKKEDLAFDSESVRPYFPYTAVKNGIFALYGELFGVTFRPIAGAPTWAPEVEAWEMLDGDGQSGMVLGRFWLDMHPRADKFGHAAMFPIQTGLSGKHAQIAWASLVCNFPAPSPTDKGLMGHDEVVTFFHEFGHLIQHLLARGPTVKLAGDIDFDFIEAPSQLLEEWAWTPNILQRFARHVDTGEPIPADLVKRMKDADAFGRGMDLLRQIHLSAFSWFMHVEDPAALDFEAFTTAMYQKYSPYPRPEVDHLYANFGHLTDYSSNYYTYQWSLAIAKDLFTRFESGDGSGLVNLAVSADYRKKLLEPGATRDINAMIEDFLGRPRNLEAYRKWIAN